MAELDYWFNTQKKEYQNLKKKTLEKYWNIYDSITPEKNNRNERNSKNGKDQ